MSAGLPAPLEIDLDFDLDFDPDRSGRRKPRGLARGRESRRRDQPCEERRSLDPGRRQADGAGDRADLSMLGEFDTYRMLAELIDATSARGGQASRREAVARSTAAKTGRAGCRHVTHGLPGPESCFVAAALARAAEQPLDALEVLAADSTPRNQLATSRPRRRDWSELEISPSRSSTWTRGRSRRLSELLAQQRLPTVLRPGRPLGPAYSSTEQSSRAATSSWGWDAVRGQRDPI